jgi:hypothetical protein
MTENRPNRFRVGTDRPIAPQKAIKEEPRPPTEGPLLRTESVTVRRRDAMTCTQIAVVCPLAKRETHTAPRRRMASAYDQSAWNAISR